jgi:hypothetical protein
MARTFVIAVAVILSASAAFAQNSTGDAWKSECIQGVAMIKAELKKQHPPAVHEQLQKALDRANIEVTENDWVECRQYIAEARTALGRK